VTTVRTYQKGAQNDVTKLQQKGAAIGNLRAHRL
jgi:hypothetical protein